MANLEQRSPILFVLDYDGTCYRSPENLRELGDNCWLELTYWIGIEIHGLSHDEALALARAHRELYGKVSEESITLEQGIEQLFLLWTQNGRYSLSKAALVSISERFQYRLGIEDFVKQLLAMGQVMVATGAFDLAARAMTRFKIQEEMCFANSTLIFDEDDNWKSLEHDPDLAGKKLFQLCDYLQKNQHITTVVVIGDGSSDVKLFEQTADSLSIDHFIRVAVGDYFKNKGILADITVGDEDWTTIPQKIQELLPIRLGA